MPPKKGLGGFGNASAPTTSKGGGFATHTSHDRHHKEKKAEQFAVTQAELKHVESVAKHLADVEKTRAPPYTKKINLRKDLWTKMCAVLETGQVENQKLMAATKEKIKVEKEYAMALKDLAKGAKPMSKGDPAMSSLDQILFDQAEIGDELLAYVTEFLEKEVLEKINEASASYASEVGVIHKSGVDLLHLFDVADTQVKTAFEHFKAISNMKAIQEQHYKEKAKIANDDSLTSGLSDHDLWFGEMKYRVSVIFCQSSFEQYDDNFQAVIERVKELEVERRESMNRIMMALVAKQEAMRGEDAALKEKEKTLEKDTALVLKNKGLEELQVVLGEIIPYPDLKLGSPLESELCSGYWTGEYKSPGVSMGGFKKCLLLRTIDDHLHVFEIPKDTAADKHAEDIFTDMIPKPHVPKEHKAKKKSKTTTHEAPKKSSAEKHGVKPNDMLLKPDYTIAVAACDCFKMGNKGGDVVVTQRVKKKGMMGGENVSKFVFHEFASSEKLMTILDEVFETEKEWKAARQTSG